MQEQLESLLAQGMSEEDARLLIDEMMREARVAEQKRREQARDIGAKLYNDLTSRQQRRSKKEEEWRNSILQYNGRYTKEQLDRIRLGGGCELFTNLTRPKTDSFAATMADKLLPTSDKNWSLQPTPIAEVAGLSKSTVQVDQTPEGQPVQARDMAQGVQEVAEERCKRMERQIEDYLAECDYNSEQRAAIEFGALLGTIIMRGPAKAHAPTMQWHKSTAPDGKIVWEMKASDSSNKPAAAAVDPFHFYPDDTAVEANIEACDSVFETFFVTKKNLRAMAKAGFDAEAISEILEGEPAKLPAWFINLESDNEPTATAKRHLYELWLWSGEMDKDELRCLGLPEEMLEVLDDELDAYPAQVWGVGPLAIKVSLNPSDTGELPYSAMQVVRDRTNFFGHGVPWAGQNAQEGANAAWRMLNDNAGLSVGPQTVIDPAVITGGDGDNKMRPRKLWYAKNPEDADMPIDVRSAMQFFEINGHIPELTQLLKLNLEMFDQEMNFSMVMQGAADENTPETKGGTQILYNAGQTVVHRLIKQYDDKITTPMLKRFYHWEMQHGKDDNVKGDYCVIAKGSSVLMERQEQLQAMNQAAQVALDPANGYLVDRDKFIEDYFKNLRLTGVLFPEEKRETKRKEWEERQAQSQPQGDPARMAMAQVAAKKVDADAQLKSRELDIKEREITVEQELAAKELFFRAQESGMGIDEMFQRLGLEQKKVGLQAQKIDSENQRFNTEIATKVQQGSGI